MALGLIKPYKNSADIILNAPTAVGVPVPDDVLAIMPAAVGTTFLDPRMPYTNAIAADRDGNLIHIYIFDDKGNKLGCSIFAPQAAALASALRIAASAAAREDR